MKWWTKAPKSRNDNAVSRSESGVLTLTELIAVHQSHLTSEENEKYLTKATHQLQGQGTAGADALAGLISELVACRSKDVVFPMIVAESLSPSPKLVGALRDLSSTASSNPGVAPPHPQRFQSELFGAGQIAWSDDTAMFMRRRTAEVLQRLAPDAVPPQPLFWTGGAGSKESAADIPTGTKVSVANDRSTPPGRLAALVQWALPIAWDNVEETREAIDVLIAAAQNPSTPPEALEAISTQSIGIVQLAQNPNCPAHVLKKIATCGNPYTESCARENPNFPK